MIMAKRDQSNHKKDYLSANLESLRVTLRATEAEKACQLIEQNSATYAQLWDTLQCNPPSYERFVALGFAFTRLNRRIKGIWKNMYTAASKGVLRSISAKFCVLYYMYAQQILHDEKDATMAHEMNDRPELLIQGDSMTQHMGSGNAVAAISASAKDLGQIKTFNSALCELTGYCKDELKGMQMERLVPTIYRGRHRKELEVQCGFMDGGEGNSECSCMMLRGSFIQHKSQHIASVSIQVMGMPNYTNDYCFLIRIRKHPEEYNVLHLLVQSDGLIVCTSSSTFHIS